MASRAGVPGLSRRPPGVSGARRHPRDARGRGPRAEFGRPAAGRLIQADRPRAGHVTFHVVIPARYSSTRLPGKPLLDIGGRSMIQRVVEQASASAAAEVLVATDDERIAGAVRDPRGRSSRIALLTDPNLPSGTDRVAAVARERGWDDATIVVNVQGDEPFVPPALIDQAAALLDRDREAAIA